MVLTEQEKRSLLYLKKHGPLWSGCRSLLEAGKPMTDPDIPRWLKQGLIAPKGDGYMITNTGIAAIEEPTPVCSACGKPL